MIKEDIGMTSILNILMIIFIIFLNVARIFQTFHIGHLWSLRPLSYWLNRLIETDRTYQSYETSCIWRLHIEATDWAIRVLA
jgi:hypothetical protein